MTEEPKDKHPGMKEVNGALVPIDTDVPEITEEGDEVNAPKDERD